MKPRLLATLLALAGAAAFWLSSAAAPSASPARDPVEGALPPEAFAELDFDVIEVRKGKFQFWLYNGSEFVLNSFDFEVELTDFPWQGDDHNSRTWHLRGGAVSYGSNAPLQLSRWDYDLPFQVDPATIRVKVLSADGYQPRN